jgi:hypothetical protein
MMTTQDESSRFNNRGALWESRTGEDGDFTGKINIDGTDYPIVARFNPKSERLAKISKSKVPQILLYHVPTLGEDKP